MATSWPARRQLFVAVAFFAVVLATYLATSSAHLGGGDNAEFVTIFARGGVAHPSGYPLYCILLRLCAWMPGGPVLGSSRVTAILGALSVAALHRACRAWGASPSASLIGAAWYALSPLAWRLATEAEVFALNALFASLLLWAAGPGLRIAPARRLHLLAGLAGLALSNHLTIVLLAPVGVLATIRAFRSCQSRARMALVAVCCFGAGLLPYLYCYEVGRDPEGRYVWGEPGTLAGLVRHVTRADFGSLTLSAADAPIGVSSSLALFFAQTADHLLVVPILAGVLGFALACMPASDRDDGGASDRGRRIDRLVLLAAWALAGPVFAIFLDLPAGALGAAALVERFRLLPELVFAIGIAWGLDAWPALRDGRALPLSVATLAIVAVVSLRSWPEVRASHGDALELYARNTKSSAPPDAVILGTGDYRLFSFLYTDAIDLRPDVTYVDPHLLGYGWYRRRAGRQLGAPISSSGDVLALVDQAFALGRPVLLADIFDARVAGAFPSYPFGTMIRLLPRGTRPPAPESVEQENLGIFAAFQRWEPGSSDDEWARSVLPLYQRPWIALARMFERQGLDGAARANRARVEQWGR